MDLHVDVRGLWLRLRDGWQTVLISTLAAMSFAGLYTFFCEAPVFRAAAILKINSKSQMSSMGFDFPTFGGGSGGDGSKLQNQIDFFHSPDFSDLMIAKLADDPALLNAFIESSGGNPLSDKELAAVKERKPLSLRRRNELVSLLNNSLSAFADSNGGSLNLWAESTRPQIAFRMAETTSQVLLEENYRKVLSKVNRSRDFLTLQTRDLRIKLKSLETELVDFQNKNHMLSEQDITSSTYQAYQRNRERVNEIRRQISSNVRLQEKLTQDMEGLRNNMTNPNLPLSNLYLSQLQSRMNVLQYQKALVASNDGNKSDTHEINALNTELETVSTDYRHALQLSESGRPVSTSAFDYFQSMEKDLLGLRQSRNRLESELNVLTTDIANQSVQVNHLPQMLQNLMVLKRNIDVNTQLYLASKKKLQEVQFIQADTVNDLVMLVNPRLPQVPIGMPIFRMFIYAAFVGGFLGWLIILLRDSFIHTVRGRRDFEGSGVEFLSGVALTIPAPTRASDDGALKVVSVVRREYDNLMAERSPMLVLEKAPESYGADNFRALRMKLLATLNFAAKGDGILGKVIMVSGPVAGCGKSYVAANLASAIGRSNVNTLLVDLNLRNPTLSKFFPSVQVVKGIEALEGGGTDGESLIVNGGPSLDLLLSAKSAAHPPDLLESKALHELFDHLRSKYDVIVVDSPAILGSIDASLIASFADAVVMVAGYQRTFAEDVKLAASSLSVSGAKPIYGVINLLNPENGHRAAA